MWPRMTSNSLGENLATGRHVTAGQATTSACGPLARHRHLIASRARSVTTSRPPRSAPQSNEPPRYAIAGASHLIQPPARRWSPCDDAVSPTVATAWAQPAAPAGAEARGPVRGGDRHG